MTAMRRLTASGMLMLLAACGAPALGTSAACTVGAAHCHRQVLALQPGTDPAVAVAWLEQRGWAVEQRLDSLWTLLIRMPRDAAAAAALRAQPWVRHLGDPVASQPGTP